MSMENNTPTTPLPPLQTAEHLLNGDENFLASEAWWGEEIDKCLLDFAEPYKAPSWTLSNQGVCFAPLGDLHGICGLSGHGKTWLMVQIMVALLKGEFGTLKCELPEPPTVLYCDTEQSKDSSIALKHRVCSLCGLNPQVPQSRFKILTLREYESVVRWRKILKAVYEIRPTCLFIDGILDIVQDFNNNQECNHVISALMATCSHYKMSIWSVLHENPFGGKMVGHLGSTLLRKATDILKCEKQTKGSEIFFEVSQTKCRGRDFPSWKFETLPVDDFGRVQMIGTPQEPDNNLPQQALEGTPPQDFDWLSDMGEWLTKALHDGALSEPCTLAEVRNVLREYGGVTNHTRLQKNIQALRNSNVLRPQPKEEWRKAQRYPKFTLKLD